MTLAKLLLSLMLLLALGSGLVLWQIVDDEPQVQGEAVPTPADLRRAREFLRHNLQAGQATTLTLSDSDFSLLGTYLLAQLHGGSASVEVEDSLLRLHASIGLPENRLGKFVNLQVELEETDSVPMLSRLEIGNLRIPSTLADPLLRFSHAELMQGLPDYAILLSAIHRYNFDDGAVTLEYELQEETLGVLALRARELLLSPEFTEALLDYSDRLGELATQHSGRYQSLNAVMGPMFAHAAMRGGDPVEENRAAILAMALYQLDIDVPRLLEGVNPRPMGRRKLRFTLHGRYDLAQHFLGSAGLAVSADAHLANYVGLLKEVDDTHADGSGFSFADLAADRSGSRFGEVAITNSDSALHLQRLISESSDEGFFMDDFRDLPEFLDANSVNLAYEDRDGSFYLEQLAAIDERIARTPLFAILGLSFQPSVLQEP